MLGDLVFFRLGVLHAWFPLEVQSCRVVTELGEFHCVPGLFSWPTPSVTRPFSFMVLCFLRPLWVFLSFPVVAALHARLVCVLMPLAFDCCWLIVVLYYRALDLLLYISRLAPGKE